MTSEPKLKPTDYKSKEPKSEAGGHSGMEWSVPQEVVTAGQKTPGTSPEQWAQMRRCFDGPSWRWKFAQALLGNPRLAGNTFADPLVLAAREYLRHTAGNLDHRERGTQAFPRIAAAESLCEQGTMLEELKILVVGDYPPTEIAARLQLDVQTVETWEALFYDIRPMRTAITWVLGNVVHAEREQGDVVLASKLQFALAGPAAAQAILDAGSRVFLPDGETLLQKKIRLALKFDQAAQLPVDSEKAKMFFMKLHLRLMQDERRIEHFQQQLLERCRRALHKQKLADARLEKARQRADARLAKARQRQRERMVRTAEKETRNNALQQACRARREAARQRATTSPLAELCWEHSTAVTRPKHCHPKAVVAAA